MAPAVARRGHHIRHRRGGYYDQPFTSRHIEVTDGGHTVAAAEVILAEGIAYASLCAAPGHITPGRRASLVDALMELPEVRASSRLQATIPLGDVELLQRLRERTQNPVTRPAGSTALLDATIPPCGPGISAESESRGPRHHGRRADSARPGPNAVQASKEAITMDTTPASGDSPTTC